jgi:DNA-binding SARP family transcriptional activator
MSGVAVQRRRLALLALLAANPDGLSRDRIIGLLWPERKEDRARHALAQLVHAVRRSMGEHPPGVAPATTKTAMPLLNTPQAVSRLSYRPSARTVRCGKRRAPRRE